MTQTERQEVAKVLDADVELKLNWRDKKKLYLLEARSAFLDDQIEKMKGRGARKSRMIAEAEALQWAADYIRTAAALLERLQREGEREVEWTVSEVVAEIRYLQKAYESSDIAFHASLDQFLYDVEQGSIQPPPAPDDKGEGE